MVRAISYVLTFSGGAVFGIAFLCLLQAGKSTNRNMNMMMKMRWKRMKMNPKIQNLKSGK